MGNLCQLIIRYYSMCLYSYLSIRLQPLYLHDSFFSSSCTIYLAEKYGMFRMRERLACRRNVIMPEGELHGGGLSGPQYRPRLFWMNKITMTEDDTYTKKNFLNKKGQQQYFRYSDCDLVTLTFDLEFKII